MSTRQRRSAKARNCVATARDLQRKLNLPSQPQTTRSTEEAEHLPPQEPPFLADLPPLGQVYEPQQPITAELKNIIDTNFYGGAFQEAIQTVAKQCIPELNRIQNLYQFYFYVDALVTWIPEIRVWCWDGELLHERTVYLRITQFYYYFNQATLADLQSPIAPCADEELSPISRWLRDFAVSWGEFLDTPESRQYLESFKYAPEYNWQEYQKAPEEYANFNAFFARTFKDIEVQRPVARKDDDRVVVFPAESTFVGQWAVSTPVGPPLPAPPSIVVKHIEWSIEELLQDSGYGGAFAGGLFSHSFLNTYDYHRLHTSVAGKVLEAKFIPGQVYLDVDLEVQGTLEYQVKEGSADANDNLARAVIPRRYLDAQDPTGYQFVQCRGLIVLESAIGKVAILPMGMAQVSSVVFVTPKADGHRPIVLTPEERKGLNYQQQVKMVNEKIQKELVGRHLDKGEMFSYFQFGGSDCVMVFERKANIDVTAKTGVHYLVRSQFACANINP